jgi:PhoH-like ATPase
MFFSMIINAFSFQENDLVIPIVVLEELDKLKKGNDLINFHAREFTRELDKLSGDHLFNGGITWEKVLANYQLKQEKPFLLKCVNLSLKKHLTTGYLL